MKNLSGFRLIALLALLLVSLSLAAQKAAEGLVVPDSLSALPDSLNAKSAQLDSLFYSAESIRYDYKKNLIRLYGLPIVNYQDSEIQADSLYVDLDRERAFSYGPTRMRDGEQLLLGSNVRYDVNTQTGMLDNGYSMVDKGYYGGKELRKIASDIYDIDGGTFTNCELEEPSFWFWSRQLRIYRSDKIVGKPVIGYVNHFPIFYFPFITVPIKKGRYPGFLIPSPDYNNIDGISIRDIAYYYPYKDYADVTLGLDLMEKTGWNAKFNTEYIKRYAWSGNLNASFRHGISPSGINNDWAVQGRHHQDLPDKASLDANLNFISNKRIWQSSNDLDQTLAQRLTSSVAYSKPMGSSYFSAGSNFTQDLVNDAATLSLPSASFSLSSRPLSELFGLSSDSWLSSLNYRYSAFLDHTGFLKEKKYSFGDLIWDNTTDPADTTGLTMLNEHHFGLRHNLGLGLNYKLFGWLNLSQGIEATEVWMDRDKKDKKPARGADVSASMNARFNLYGIKNFAKFPITSVRHTLSPVLGISYQPSSKANADLYSFGGIGVRSSGKSANLNLSVDNKWQIKYGSGANEKKMNELLSLSSKVAMDLLKKDKPFSTITHSLALRPEGMSLGDLSFNNGAYKLGGLRLAYASQFSFSQNPYKVNLHSLNLGNQYFTQSIALGGSAPYKNYYTPPKNTRFSSFSRSDSLNVVADMLEDSAGNNNWSLSLTHDLTASKDIFHAQNSNLRLALSCKLTQNWSMSFSNYTDLKSGKSLSRSFALSRDLHCWKMDISVNYRNDYWDYRILLFNKLLPDALRLQTRGSKQY